MIRLDPPSPKIIETPYFGLRGWTDFVAGDHEFALFCGGEKIEFSIEKREDLVGLFAFNAYVDFPNIPEANYLQLECLDLCCGKRINSERIPIGESAFLRSAEEKTHRDKRRKFIQDHLSPHANIEISKHNGSFFDSNAVDLSLKTDPISANGYGPELWNFLNTFGTKDTILEAGAGFRYFPVNSPLVINQELFKYPSTDLACDLHRIPIKDNSFDGAIISAVFEHVKNPFEVAGELARVVKKGGRIYVDVPFLQAEHGYPNHYFNMTRMGVQEIFAGRGRILEQFLPEINETKNTIKQILNLYIDAVSCKNEVAKNMLNEMRVGEFLNYIDNIKLKAEDDFKTAWGTTSIIEIF